MTSTSQTAVDQTPPITTLSTFPNPPTGVQPFMIALDFFTGNPRYSNIEDYPPDLTTWRSTLSGPFVRSRVGSNDTINFEPCTREHFWMFPNIDEVFLQWEAQRWMCLPRNQTYII